MKRVYILLADGFEVIEALAPIDVLCRAGVEVRRIAVGGSLDVTSSHNHATLHCDALIEDSCLSDGDAVILPGGNPGYINLRNSDAVRSVVREFMANGGLVAAICGAPTVLASAGVAHGRRITCHSSVVADMEGYDYVGGDVVEDDNLITGAGAGVSVEFALAVAARLVDSDVLSHTRRGMEV